MRLNEEKVRLNEKEITKLLATIARGGVVKSHSKAIDWAQRIFFIQKVGDKRRYVSPQEASKLIGSM